VEVMNDSGHKVRIHWVDPKSGELVRFLEPYLYEGESVSFDSFVNHTFLIEEVVGKNETTCKNANDNSCHFSQMTVTSNEEQGELRH
jgi:hypothetical protein